MQNITTEDKPTVPAGIVILKHPNPTWRKTWNQWICLGRIILKVRPVNTEWNILLIKWSAAGCDWPMDWFMHISSVLWTSFLQWHFSAPLHQCRRSKWRKHVAKPFWTCPQGKQEARRSQLWLFKQDEQEGFMACCGAQSSEDRGTLTQQLWGVFFVIIGQKKKSFFGF